MNSICPIACTDCVAEIAAAFTLANRAVITDIECEAVRVHLPEPGRWYDTRPMLDPREHAPQALDMAAQALDYALRNGLVHRHSQQPHVVRINTAATA